MADSVACMEAAAEREARTIASLLVDQQWNWRENQALGHRCG